MPSKSNPTVHHSATIPAYTEHHVLILVQSLLKYTFGAALVPWIAVLRMFKSLMLNVKKRGVKLNLNTCLVDPFKINLSLRVLINVKQAILNLNLQPYRLCSTHT
jgi:hypothetical protein